MDPIRQRKLIIKTFHVDNILSGHHVSLKDGVLTFVEPSAERVSACRFIHKVTVEIIRPGDYDRFTNSIMDVIPVSTKVLGRLGEGITHTLTGVVVMITGVDEAGVPQGEFGSSEGNLRKKLKLDRAGTPSSSDLIINFDVVLKEGMGIHREAVLEVHALCDEFIQKIRDVLKKLDGRLSTEKHEFYDVIRPGKKRVVLVKQIAGQGAMYDNGILPLEPSGFDGARSIIDMGNLPILLSPNEYRDGAVRAMT